MKLIPSTSRVGRLVNPAFYIQRYPDVAATGMTPAEHFVALGHHQGRDPNPLFDTAWYRDQRGGIPRDVDAVSHYLDFGARSGAAPHPLFDPAHYAAQMGGVPAELTPLEHYLAAGWIEGLSPHPLFDPAYYRSTSSLTNAEGDPLSHYLLQSDYNYAPHYLFSDEVYVADIQTLLRPRDPDAYRTGAPLLHYVLYGARYLPKTHPLFDGINYINALRIQLAATSDPKTPIVEPIVADALRHYLEVGVARGVSPSPFFDVAHVRHQLPDLEGDPLRAYLKPENFSRISPHPGMDLGYYSARAGLYADDVPSIVHLLTTPQDERMSPHPAFDPDHYKSPRVDQGGCPILDFLAYGMREARIPSPGFSESYVRNAHPHQPFLACNPVEHYFGIKDFQPKRILVVSHGANLTGAPGTALRIAEDLSRIPGIECLAIVAQHGPRRIDFQRTAHTFFLDTPFHAATPGALRNLVERVLGFAGTNRPLAAIVNSVESRFVIPYLAAAGVPVITLVHESADLYPPGTFDGLVEHSDRVVFGSDFVRKRAARLVALPQDRVVVRGQGLQQDHIGSMDRATARQKVRKELRIDDDAFLVIGCGTIDFRKGVDLFAMAALEFLRKWSEPEKACFVWIGEGYPDLARSFTETLVTADGHRAVQFVGPRVDVEPYFMASDAFLMTSRIDPFPCVCQEAMACGLPVLAFRDGGGTVEMIGDEAGFAIPDFNATLMADQLLELAANEPLRRQLGARGRKLVQENWQPADYRDFLLSLVAEVSETALSPPTREGSGDVRVFILHPGWLDRASAEQVEALTVDLAAAGHQVQHVFTRGRFAEPVPRERDIYLPIARIVLQPDHVGQEGLEAEIVQSLRRFLRRSMPCVVFATGDIGLVVDAARANTRVKVVGILDPTNGADAEELYRLGPSLGGILAYSKSDAQQLLNLNPLLLKKVHLVSGARWSGQGRLKVLLDRLTTELADASSDESRVEG